MAPPFLASLPASLAAIVLIVTGPAAAQPLSGEPPQSVADTFVATPRGVEVKTWVDGLEVPWSLVFLPDGRALVSERPGRIRLIDANGRLRAAPYGELAVHAVGEGGLMGLAVHPDFPRQPFIYAMLTRDESGKVANAVIRLRDEGSHASFDRVIIDGIPAAQFHDGGRIAFGPDGMLYIGTGDATRPERAQDRFSLAGKILRLTPEGAVPRDNPFPGSPVYSYGHRNVQGLAWSRSGQLFASEHGPSGEFGLHARDEINLIRPGANYGWPLATCAVRRTGLVDPLVCWTGRSVPPGGIAFHGGDLFVPSLRAEALIRISFGGQPTAVRSIERWFATGPSNGRFGRLRDVVAGPDGALYVLTSNQDGRGDPHPGDDRILRLRFTG